MACRLTLSSWRRHTLNWSLSSGPILIGKPNQGEACQSATSSTLTVMKSSILLQLPLNYLLLWSIWTWAKFQSRRGKVKAAHLFLCSVTLALLVQPPTSQLFTMPSSTSWSTLECWILLPWVSPFRLQFIQAAGSCWCSLEVKCSNYLHTLLGAARHLPFLEGWNVLRSVCEFLPSLLRTSDALSVTVGFLDLSTYSTTIGAVPGGSSHLSLHDNWGHCASGNT